jgi:recombination protein RecA
LDLAVRYSVVSKSGAHYSYGQQRVGRGREEARAFLEKSPTIAAEIEAGVYMATGIAAERTGPIERDRDDEAQSLPVSGEPLAVAA